jgi:hypothetical protein
MARRRSTLDAFAPVRTPQAEPEVEAAAQPVTIEERPATPPIREEERPQPRPAAEPKPAEAKPPPAEAASMSSVLDRVARQIPQPQGEVQRLTVYLPPSAYDELTAVWSGIRKRTGIKIGKASLALAALETVLASPELVEKMVLRATEERLG